MICQNGWRDFTEILGDQEASASSDAPASNSREPPRKVASGERSIFTHFPKDRNCEVCKRTKITKAPCRKRTSNPVLRAEHCGGLITRDHKVLSGGCVSRKHHRHAVVVTTDHKVLSEGCESRNHHRHAVVAQDVATQWLQSYPCKTKSSQETEKSLR